MASCSSERQAPTYNVKTSVLVGALRPRICFVTVNEMTLNDSC